MKSEIERLVEAIENSDELQEEVNQLGTDPEDLLEWARRKGYEFSLDDFNAYAETRVGELSSDDLDQVAGGAMKPGAGSTGRRFHAAIGNAIDPANKIPFRSILLRRR